jgi:hypothetical protein
VWSTSDLRFTGNGTSTEINTEITVICTILSELLRYKNIDVNNEEKSTLIFYDIGIPTSTPHW